MPKCCEICGKTPRKSADRSFSMKKNVHTQEPNLQTVKAVINGTTKKVRVCTSCIRAGKVQKA